MMPDHQREANTFLMMPVASCSCASLITSGGARRMMLLRRGGGGVGGGREGRRGA